jgi:tetratricopeptide (TPR) repeat protein
MLKAQGDLAGARTLQEQVFEATARLLGKDRPDTLRSMNNLAWTLYAQGDLAGARTLQEQVLEATARLLGKEHPNTLTSINNLAQMLYAQGDLAGARTLQEQVFEATARLLGKEHPDTLRSMGNLAWTLYAQGDLGGARTLQEQGSRPRPGCWVRRRPSCRRIPPVVFRLRGCCAYPWDPGARVCGRTPKAFWSVRSGEVGLCRPLRPARRRVARVC